MKPKLLFIKSHLSSPVRLKAFWLVMLMAFPSVIAFSPSVAANRLLKVFEVDSLNKIKKHHAGSPFILVVWSVDCLPCRQEFDMLREIKNQYPQLNLSIVATESVQDVPQLLQILSQHQLVKEDNWAFAETNSAKLRYALDSNWYGELPRAYFYDQKHSRIAVSGKIPKSKVISWLTRVSPTK